MKKSITAITMIIGLMVWFGGCGPSEKTVTLRFKYLGGAQFEYDQSAVRRWKVTEKDTTVQEVTSNISMKVLQVVSRTLEDSTAAIVERSTWDITVPNKEDKSKIDTLHDKREMIVYMTTRGKVVDLEFVSKVDSAERQYIREYYDQGFMVFPEEPVKKGSSWTQTAKVALPDTNALASTKFTVEDFGVEQGYEVTRIAYDGNLLIPVHENPNDTLKRSGLDRIHIKGMLNFAHKEGLVVNMNERWEIDGDRRRLKDSVWGEYKILADMDINYELVSPTKDQ